MSNEQKQSEWTNIPEQTITPEAAVRARKALVKLQGAVEWMIASEQKRLAILRQQLHRAKHGGGS